MLTLHNKVKNDITIVVSPINQNLNSKSNIDYKEQVIRRNNKQQIMWDDTKFNKQKKDGIFIFLFNRTKNNYGKVQIHKVEEVLSPNNRLNTWSLNVGQTNRNVLYLSRSFLEINWDKWLEIGGTKKVQGTQHINKNKNKIIDFINSTNIIF